VLSTPVHGCVFFVNYRVFSLNLFLFREGGRTKTGPKFCRFPARIRAFPSSGHKSCQTSLGEFVVIKTGPGLRARNWCSGNIGGDR
jgi:hypothetical protein